MKLRSFLWVLTMWLITTAVSCNKCDQDNITRPDLTADELKWVSVNDTAPFFKITTFFTNGDTITDTIQGKYSLEIQQRQNDVDDCYNIYYKTYSNKLLLLYEIFNYGNYFHVDTYEESGFKGWIGNNNDKYMTKTTPLDTITVNGKFYTNVFVDYLLGARTYYYVKEIGFIYMQVAGNTIAGIQRTEIELIP